MRRASFVVAVLFCSAFSLAQAEKGKFVELFDGKTLNGWKVIGCEAEVKDGCIFMKAGNGVVRPERKFKDCVFEVEWKNLRAEKYDSGVYFRCIDPEGTYPWPRKWQANMRQGDEGNVAEFKTARSTGLVKPGEWNKFKLTLKGTAMEMEINGKPAWKADGLTEPSGFISLQAEVPGGGQFLFRNVRVMELE